MDLGDLITGLLEGMGSTREPSRRAQRVVRFLFGTVLAGLGAAGVWHVSALGGGTALRAAFAGLFGSLALFGLFGIALGRGVKPLGCLVLGTFLGVFAARILFGP